MQTLLSRSWVQEKPKANIHVGDLEWWSVLRKEEPDRVSLWHVGGDLVGLAWHSPPAQLDMHVRLEHRSGALYEQMLDWFLRSVHDRAVSPDEVVAFVFEPTSREDQAVRSKGFEPTERGYLHHARSLEGSIEVPMVPTGFELRHMEGPQDIDRRVAVHRSAFAPSRMTPERYRETMAQPHYRPDLDWVTVAPNGEFASFCNVWLDDQSGVALLEPVGTDDRFRRRGLARAACLAAVRAVAELGADTAVVLSDRENQASTSLYRGLGFEEVGQTRRYERRV